MAETGNEHRDRTIVAIASRSRPGVVAAFARNRRMRGARREPPAEAHLGHDTFLSTRQSSSSGSRLERPPGLKIHTSGEV